MPATAVRVAPAAPTAPAPPAVRPAAAAPTLVVASATDGTAAGKGATGPTGALRLRQVPPPPTTPWSPRAPGGADQGTTGPTRPSTLPLFAVRPVVLAPPDGADDAYVRPGGDGAGRTGPHGAAAADGAGGVPDELARRLVQAVVDVVRGHRPASQLLRWTTPEVYAGLRERARLEQARDRRPTTARANGDSGNGRRPAEGRRPVVRSVRTAAAGPTGVEVSAVVLDGARARAVAARLDAAEGRWRLTALQVG